MNQREARKLALSIAQSLIWQEVGSPSALTDEQLPDDADQSKVHLEMMKIAVSIGRQLQRLAK